MSRCCVRVFDRGWPRDCEGGGLVNRDGDWFCSVHDPVKVAERAAEREQRELPAKLAAKRVAVARERLASATSDLLHACGSLVMCRETLAGGEVKVACHFWQSFQGHFDARESALIELTAALEAQKRVPR